MKDAPHTTARILARFLRESAGDALVRLSEVFPGVVIWAKDRRGRFVFCNRAFLRLVGSRSEREVLGRRDADFFPPDLCEIYARDDRLVFERGEPLVETIELVRKRDRSIDWHSTSKTPIADRKGRVVAVLGVTRDLKRLSLATDRFLSLAPAVEAMISDFAEPLRVAALAARVGLSISQFERQFKRKFGTTPRAYLARTRIEAACQLLSGTDLRVAEVAQRTGFCDQSHFTHTFIKHRRITPSAYRALYPA